MRLGLYQKLVFSNFSDVGYRAQAAPGDAILLHPPQCCTEMIIFTKTNLNDQPLGSSGFQMFNLKGMRKDLTEIQKVVREREGLL